MTRECELIQERIVAGEWVAADEAHLLGCAECASISATAERVRAALAARSQEAREPEGLAPRAAARALERDRARRRTAGLALGVTVAAAVVVVAAIWVGRDREPRSAGRDTRTPSTTAGTRPLRAETIESSDVARELILASDVDDIFRPSDGWRWVEQPMAGIRLLTPELKGDVR